MTVKTQCHRQTVTDNCVPVRVQGSMVLKSVFTSKQTTPGTIHHHKTYDLADSGSNLVRSGMIFANVCDNENYCGHQL